MRERSFQAHGSGKLGTVHRNGRGRAAGTGALLGPLGSKGVQGLGAARIGVGRGEERRRDLTAWGSYLVQQAIQERWAIFGHQECVGRP